MKRGLCFAILLVLLTSNCLGNLRFLEETEFSIKISKSDNRKISEYVNNLKYKSLIKPDNASDMVILNKAIAKYEDDNKTKLTHLTLSLKDVEILGDNEDLIYSGFERLDKLDLLELVSVNVLDIDGVDIIVNTLAKIQIKNLILQFSDLSSVHSEDYDSRFSKALLKSSAESLTDLSFRKTELRDSFWEHFSNNGNQFKNLTRISYTESDADITEAKRIASFLQNNSTVKRIYLYSNNFDDDSYKLILNAAILNNSIEMIDVSLTKTKFELSDETKKLITKFVEKGRRFITK